MEWIRSLMVIWNSNKPILLLSHASRRLVSNLRSRQYFLPTFYKLKYKLLASKKSVELINARLNDFRSNKFERQSYKIDRNWRFCIGEKITKSKSIVRRNFLPPKFLQKGVFESDRPDASENYSLSNHATANNFQRHAATSFRPMQISLLMVHLWNSPIGEGKTVIDLTIMSRRLRSTDISSRRSYARYRAYRVFSFVFWGERGGRQRGTFWLSHLRKFYEMPSDEIYLYIYSLKNRVIMMN